MRSILTVLLLLLSAPALHAQAVPSGASEQPAGFQQVTEPLPPPIADAEAAPAAVLHRQAAEQAVEMAEPIFDRNFWRSVLAGVVASVLTAVILRVIL